MVKNCIYEIPQSDYQMNSSSEMKKIVQPRSWIKAPHPLVLLYCIVVFAYGLTWVLPSGAYKSAANESGTRVVVPGSFELLDEDIDLPVWNLLTVVPRGLAGAQGVIFLVLILGGALAVVRSRHRSPPVGRPG